MYNIDRLVHRTRKGAKSKRLAYHFNGHCTKDKCNMTTIAIPLSKTGKYAGRYETIISIEDADLVVHAWSVKLDRNTYYVQRRVRSKMTLLHRVILARKLGRDELLPSEQVDHISGDGLDNRRENLRLATHSQNKHNQRRAKNNTSGYKGVWKEGNRYRAKITINRQTFLIGVFDTPELAHRAYCDAVDKYHGEYGNKG